MALRILILGRIPPELHRELAGLAGGPRLLERDASAALAELIPAERPHLVILGEGASLMTGPADDSSRAEIVPVVSILDDPEADFRLPEDEESRHRVLRAAVRMARLRQSQLAALERASVAADSERERIHQWVDREFTRATRYRHPLSVLVLSVDGVPDLRRTHGAGALESLMAQAMEATRRATREVDVPFRLAVDQIGVLFPETDVAGARSVAERLRAQIRRLLVKPPTADDRPALPLKATCSIGVADGPREGLQSGGELLAAAIAALEAARRQGGDRVVAHG